MTTSAKPTAITVMIVEDEAVIANGIRVKLAWHNYKAVIFPNAEEALDHLAKEAAPLPSVVLMDINLSGGIDGIDAAKIITSQYGVPVIFLTGFDRPDYQERLLEAKPFAFFLKPIKFEHLMISIDAAIRLGGTGVVAAREAQATADNVDTGLEHRFVGNSLSAQKTREEIGVLGPTNLPIVVIGETGTGKEIITRELHLSSERRDKPYIPVNCATLGTLADSELFGHARGAFTGALQSTNGHVGTADHGTLFLDEAETLPMDTQAKLLRFLDSGDYCKVGESQIRKADIRILSASNRDLEELCKEGKLRRDLFYRLAGAIIRTTPLRERREDIPQLVRHFLAIFAKEGRRHCRINNAVINAMQEHDWPGNVRQLKQAIHLLCERHPGAMVTLDDTKDLFGSPKRVEEEVLCYKEAKAQNLADFDRRYFSNILANSRGSLKTALTLSGMHKKNFYQKLKDADLATRNFK